MPSVKKICAERNSGNKIKGGELCNKAQAYK